MASGDSPFLIPSVRGFMIFRVRFNAHSYYPVFSILFMDFGLSISWLTRLHTVRVTDLTVERRSSEQLAQGGDEAVNLFQGVVVMQ